MKELDSTQLVNLFDNLFAASVNTRLVGGASEPIYIPAGISATRDTNDDQCSFEAISSCHRLFFRHNYFSSALHEIAHWCIAGDARRLRVLH